MQSEQLSIGIGKSSDKPAGSNIMRSSSSSECAIKVRKPYTISRQRERWTDGEHDKFLEALSLYGRSWCKIEEHVGTKTAVQIRSHAQKFFAKVARESKGDDPDGRKAIEIPPPRPKKKPLRPYPRKLENTVIMQVKKKQELPLTPNIKVEAHGNMSPTSVICTDALNSSVSSPLSCANQSCQSGTTSVEDESKSNSNNKSDMDVDLVTDDSTAGKEASSVEESASSLKLFGKTLVVPEPCKAQYPTEENNNQLYLWPNGTAPMFYLLPVWGFYGDSDIHVPQAQMVMSSEEGESAFCAEKFDSYACTAELGIDSKNMEIGVGFKACEFKQSETSAFRSVKTCPNKAESKGFMPYKSCVIAEREATKKIINDIGGEDEVQLCL